MSMVARKATRGAKSSSVIGRSATSAPTPSTLKRAPIMCACSGVRKSQPWPLGDGRCDKWRRLPYEDRYRPENLPERWLCWMSPTDR